jgi:hypothetical protein
MHHTVGLGAPQQRTVFASYAHDSLAHKEQVLALAHLLMESGVDVTLDQLAKRRHDWSAWATSNMTSADYILAVASPEYRRAGDGYGSPTSNRGVQYETAVLRDLLHSDRQAWLPKLLPVVLPGHDIDEIPLFLQPYTANHYRIAELTEHGIQELLDVIFRSSVDIPAPRQEVESWRLTVRVELTVFRDIP